MADISAVTLRAIEFDRIVAIVADLAVTPTGRERLDAMVPMTEPSRVGAAQAATTEGVRFLAMSPGFPLRAPSELEAILEGLQVEGRALEPLASRRRHGEPGHDRHDAVELDRAQRHRRDVSHA